MHKSDMKSSDDVMGSGQKENKNFDETNSRASLKEELPRDGSSIIDGKLAWLACFCTVIDQIFICGLLQIFGIFFVEFVNDFNCSKSEAAWLGSLAYGCMKFFGPVSSYFVVRFTNRVAMVLGSLLCAVSLLISSFVTSMSILYLSFSILYGIGSSLVINCAMVLANSYFDHYLGWATGLVCAGSSIGTLILAPTSQVMIESLGWKITFRILVVIFIFVGFLNCLIQPIPKDRITKSTDDDSPPCKSNEKKDCMALWKNRPFILWTIGTSLGMFGYYIPFVHLVSYGVDVGIPVAKATYFIMTLGGATTIGRLVSGRIVQAGWLNGLHLNQFCMIATGALYMILPVIQSFPSLMIFVIILGLIDGCYVVLLPMLTCSLVGLDDAMVAWGMLTCAGSVTFTVGPPIAGAMYDAFGNYDIAFHIAGVPVICGALVLFFIPWAQRASSPPATRMQLNKCDMNIDSGKGSEEEQYSDLSDETINLRFLKEAGYFPPYSEYLPDVQKYVESHFTEQDTAMSTSLGDHRDKDRTFYVDIKSESLPVPLSLLCGPDGMPISVPSTMLVPNSSTSTTTTRQSLSSYISRQRRGREIIKYSDATTQSEEFTNMGTTYSTDNVFSSEHRYVSEASDSVISDLSTQNRVSTSTDGDIKSQRNHIDRLGASRHQTDVSLQTSSGTINSDQLPAAPLVHEVSASSVATCDCENLDVFNNLFKKETSDTSI